MAKGSGNTRLSNSKGFEWSGSDSSEDVLHDAQQIFKKEATAGLFQALSKGLYLCKLASPMHVYL